ncbi:MAG: OmpA family protein [Geminicoccaceae bacterium]
MDRTRTAFQGAAMRLCAIAFVSLLVIGSNVHSARAQDPAGDKGAEQPTTVDDVEALIARMQKQVQAMSAATAERDEALRYLEEQIDRAAGRIEGTEATAEAARQRAAELDIRIEDLDADRAQLSSEVDERSDLIATLERQVAELSEQLAGQDDVRTGLETQLEAERVARMGTEDLLSRTKEGIEAEKRALGREIGEREAALGVAEERVSTLEDQLERLTSQLVTVSGLLQQSDDTVRRQQSRITDLGARLNEALQAQVEELSAYRSEFFGKLREALGNRPEFRIVGDRFVFQSEVLFASGSARIDPAGEVELGRLAETLREVAGTIPPELDWILRVDGHTDRVPVGATSQFSSNWDLSTARAISVVQFLVRAGIDPHRLAATGFGEFQPLDPGGDEIAYRRNRRIEFKLTSG